MPTAPITSSPDHPNPRTKYWLLVGVVVVVLLLLPLFPSSNPDRTEAVFVYGTLLNPWIRTYACLCRTEAESVTLPSYQKVGRNIVPALGETVEGAIIRLTPQELARVDDYENVPTNYRRIPIIIDGTEYWVYRKSG